MGFVLTFTAMLCAIALLHGCTQLGKGDRDTRVWDVVMRSTDDECFVEVKGNFSKEMTDDTKTVQRPLSGG